MRANRVRNSSRGVGLIECLVYIALLAVILTLGFGTFIEAMQRSSRLDQRATQIVLALQAGEQWRADVRQSTAKPQLVVTPEGRELRLQVAGKDISYSLRGGDVMRREGSGAAWLPFFGPVRSTRFEEDRRQHVTGWRWELELAAPRDDVRLRPVFTFQAAAVQ